MNEAHAIGTLIAVVAVANCAVGALLGLLVMACFVVGIGMLWHR